MSAGRRLTVGDFWARLFSAPRNECWPWPTNVQQNGYGRVHFQGRDWLAHRLSYTLAKGPISPGLTIDHLCRNRVCCNPDHLEAVTPRENSVRGVGVAAINAAKTHCKYGHPFDGANTNVTSKGYRQCRACSRRRTAEYTNRKKVGV